MVVLCPRVLFRPTDPLHPIRGLVLSQAPDRMAAREMLPHHNHLQLHKLLQVYIQHPQWALHRFREVMQVLTPNQDLCLLSPLPVLQFSPIQVPGKQATITGVQRQFQVLYLLIQPESWVSDLILSDKTIQLLTLCFTLQLRTTHLPPPIMDHPPILHHHPVILYII